MNDLIKAQTELTTNDLSIGQIANQFAAKSSFKDYRTRKAPNTVKRQDSDLALFSDYLANLSEDCQGDFTQPNSWACVTWGLVEAFVKWQLGQGYSVSSVNVRLSTVKTYAKLAVKAGTLPVNEYAMIKMVSGYKLSEADNVDEARKEIGLNTRIDKPGAKKSKHTPLTKDQADSLKSQPDTPQGRRDSLLAHILIDHGLRCGEVVGLKVEDFNLAEGTFTFFRPKVKANSKVRYGKHQMSLQTWQAAKTYIENEQPTDSLLLGSRKGGKLTSKGMSDRAICGRVKTLGEAIGIDKLSPHDCRHYAATNLAKSKDIMELMSIFGWSSPAMAVRYVEAAKVVSVE